MRVEIEKYRGWEILFNTEDERFYVVSNEYDTQKDKPSFASARKWVDEFLKENETFKPFWIEGVPTGYRNFEKVKVIGVRKDGRFIVEKKGKKEQLSQYDEKDYMLVVETNAPAMKELVNLDTEHENMMETYRKNKKKIIEKLEITTVADYRKSLEPTP